MTIRSWLRGVASPLRRSQTSVSYAAKRPSRQLHVERLEDRTTPSLAFDAAFGIGGPGSDSGQDIAVDGDGNLYMVGNFSGSMDADPSAGETVLTSAGASDAFVAKYNPIGALIWARRIGGIPADSGYGVAVDAAGNVIVSGAFHGTADFGGISLTAASGWDAFVTRLDANGSFLWARSIDGGDSDAAFGVAVDSQGNAYSTGSLGDSDIIFVSKHDPDGQQHWFHQVGQGDSMGGHGLDIALDGVANVYITGNFAGQADFDPGPGTFTVSSTKTKSYPTGDAFVWSLDATGAFRWAGSMGGSGDDAGRGIAVDSTGNVYVTGGFGYVSGSSKGASADFNPGSAKYNLTSSGYTDAFVTKLDGNRNFLWARSMGGIGWDAGWDIAVDGAGNVHTTGVFGFDGSGSGAGTSADFDPGSGKAILTSAGYYDAFGSQLNDAGNFVWAGRMGGAGDDRGESVVLDASGNVYATGQFRGPADFDAGAGVYTLSSAADGAGDSSTDVFVLKLAPAAALQASRTGSTAGSEMLTLEQVEPLFAAALARGQAGGLDTSGLGAIDVRIADLPGTTLGLASGNTIDINAAGWGWFVDPRPADDSEFTTPGNQGEQHLLTVLMHEIGHVLDHEHDDGSVMAETLTADTQLTSFVDAADWLAAADVAFSKKSSRQWW